MHSEEDLGAPTVPLTAFAFPPNSTAGARLLAGEEVADGFTGEVARARRRAASDFFECSCDLPPSLLETDRRGHVLLLWPVTPQTEQR